METDYKLEFYIVLVMFIILWLCFLGLYFYCNRFIKYIEYERSILRRKIDEIRADHDRLVKASHNDIQTLIKEIKKLQHK